MSQTTSFKCISCGHTGPHHVILSLGELPLGNNLLSEDQLCQPELSYPLGMSFCERCALVQALEPIPPEKFVEENLYFTSVSPSLLEHTSELAKNLIRSRRLGPKSLVVEVGSNDGTMLANFIEQGIQVLGIEPVAQSAKSAENERGVTTLVELFTENLAHELERSGKSADVVMANDVLEVAPDPGDFVKGMQTLVKEDGLVVVEVPYVKDVVDSGRFDGIGHLRFSWFSVASLNHLFREQGLTITDIEYLEEFRGGSLRIFASKSSGVGPSSSVASILQEEAKVGLNSVEYYRPFAQRVDSIRDSLRKFIIEAKTKREERVAVYGAGIKASTFLNYAKLNKDYIDFVVDVNPYKQGLFMSGVDVPIYPPQRLLEEMPDYVLLLALDFTDEVLDQQSDYRGRGGRFIIPIPEFQIV
jgi:SAM-dependent methyltransferase